MYISTVRIQNVYTKYQFFNNLTELILIYTACIPTMLNMDLEANSKVWQDLKEMMITTVCGRLKKDKIYPLSYIV